MSTEQKNLSNLSPAKGSNKKKKRKGRGPGSGNGKTAGKGHKGQKARAGGGIAPGFEGGQMPLYRRLPKRGFKNPFRTEYYAINLDVLNHFEAGARITADTLAEAGLIGSPKSKPVKILGRGSLEKPLTLVVNKASKAARAAVEKVGGKLEEV